MLTKTDLKLIREVVREEIRGETPKIVHKAIQEETPEIVHKAIQEETPKIVRGIIQKDVPPIVEAIVQRELRPIKKDIRKIRNDIDIVISTFDRECLDLRRRADVVDAHLGIVTAN